MKKIFLVFGIILLLGLAACSSSNNENEDANANNNSDYPEEEIELVIPFDPGGASDMVSRAVGEELEDDLGVPVTPVNKEGATGTVGMNYIKNSEPDGYTMGYVPVELSMVESLDIADIVPDDFTLIARSQTIPATITVPEDAPYDTIEEFIDYAKDNPGEITFGTSGEGSIWHAAAASLAEEEDLDFNYVPFDGASEAVKSLLGGEVDATSVSPSEIKSALDSDDVKVLAVMSEEEDPIIPDVLTLKESGIDLETEAWGVFVVPKDTPDEIVNTLEDSIEKAVDSSTFEELAESQGVNPAFMPADEFDDFANEEYDKYNDLLPKIGF